MKPICLDFIKPLLGDDMRNCVLSVPKIKQVIERLMLKFLWTRPKPAYGRQGLDWDCWARIQFSQVHFGAKLDSTDLLWCKNVTSPTGGSNRPFRCLEEGGRALPKFLAPFQNVSKKHSGYDLLLNKYSGNQPKTMKNHETTLKNHRNQIKTPTDLHD